MFRCCLDHISEGIFSFNSTIMKHKTIFQTSFLSFKPIIPPHNCPTHFCKYISLKISIEMPLLNFNFDLIKKIAVFVTSALHSAIVFKIERLITQMFSKSVYTTTIMYNVTAQHIVLRLLRLKIFASSCQFTVISTTKPPWR